MAKVFGLHNQTIRSSNQPRTGLHVEAWGEHNNRRLMWTCGFDAPYSVGLVECDSREQVGLNRPMQIRDHTKMNDQDRFFVLTSPVKSSAQHLNP